MPDPASPAVSPALPGPGTRDAGFPAEGPVTLRTNLAESPVTHALRTGALRSDLVTFDFCGPKVANQGFKPMVREGAFDAGELAIATFLQAVAYGKPLVILPAVVMARFQHQCLVCHEDRPLGPGDLEGRRIGTRAYTVTTGVWVRGILAHEYGVDLDRLTWVAPDDPHLAEYRDPPNVERLPPGSKAVEAMLLDGEIDAAILGPEMPKPPLAPVIADPLAAAAAWARKVGAVPANHFFVLSRELAETRPDVVREAYRMLKASRALAPPSPDGIDFNNFGVDACRRALELMTLFCFEQKLIPRRFAVDELFTDLTRSLD